MLNSDVVCYINIRACWAQFYIYFSSCKRSVTSVWSTWNDHL